MSSSVLGMDVSAARDLVRLMNSDADTINQLASRLTQVLEATAWYGTDAERFRSDWNGQYVPALSRVVEALQSNAQVLSGQADQQEQASS